MCGLFYKSSTTIIIHVLYTRGSAFHLLSDFSGHTVAPPKRHRLPHTCRSFPLWSQPLSLGFLRERGFIWAHSSSHSPSRQESKEIGNWKQIFTLCTQSEERRNKCIHSSALSCSLPFSTEIPCLELGLPVSVHTTKIVPQTFSESPLNLGIPRRCAQRFASWCPVGLCHFLTSKVISSLLSVFCC